jgi:hypothetical protein
MLNQLILNVSLRHLLLTDDTRIVQLANNHKVSKYLNLAFPFPFSIEDSQKFLKKKIYFG